MSASRRIVVAAVAAGSLLFWPFGVTPASACSPPAPPPGYGALLDHVPSVGALDVPTNPAVILYFEKLQGPIQGFTIAVSEDATGKVVAGSAAHYYREREFVAWRPTAPLRPLTRYRVDAAVMSLGKRPSTATGVEHLSFPFTTADKPFPPIEAQGRMQVQIERYQHEDLSRCTTTPICGGCGGCYCESTLAREEGTRARVKLPAFSGGLSTPGYYALVRVTADVPYQFPDGEDNTAEGVRATGSISDLAAGTAVDIEVYDLERLAPYRPCFALRVADLAGNALVTESVCLDMTVEPGRKIELPPGVSLPPAQPPAPGQSPQPGQGAAGGGCTLAGVGGREGHTLWAILFALVVLDRRRRQAVIARTART
jgi:hypothetical protein